MTTRFLLVLAPGVDSQEKCWLFQPFEDQPVNNIISCAKQIFLSKYDGLISIKTDIEYLPYPHYFSGKEIIDLLPDQLYDLQIRTFSALLDGTVFVNETNEKCRNLNIKIVSQLGQFNYLSKTGFIKRNNYADQVRDMIAIPRQIIWSDDGLIAGIIYDLANMIDDLVRSAMDSYPIDKK